MKRLKMRVDVGASMTFEGVRCPIGSEKMESVNDDEKIVIEN